MELVYACKTALDTPMAWLFCNLSKPLNPDPIAQYHQTKYTPNPAVVQNMPTQIPPLNIPSAVLADRSRQELGDYSTEIYEWLSLVRLESPRVGLRDDINPYLSTYTVPGDLNGINEGQLCKITWQGFISPGWVANTLAGLIRTLPPEGWFSFSTTPFTRGVMGLGADYTIMRPPSSPGEYLLWEIKGHE
ncbi:hypothetical protein RRF57_010212 [Xylaria bambusicola]|uniref:Uncharacterized protein n=1 Tax=Xylaria bambusicola TaxID=326684 RepID=A0AAN7V101_9PEZI